jgi:hypothetical protein
MTLNESEILPWESKINLESFGTFRGLLFHQPITGRELFLEARYVLRALELIENMKLSHLTKHTYMI